MGDYSLYSCYISKAQPCCIAQQSFCSQPGVFQHVFATVKSMNHSSIQCTESREKWLFYLLLNLREKVLGP